LDDQLVAEFEKFLAEKGRKRSETEIEEGAKGDFAQTPKIDVSTVKENHELGRARIAFLRSRVDQLKKKNTERGSMIEILKTGVFR
jgi:hypothetical protein